MNADEPLLRFDERQQTSPADGQTSFAQYAATWRMLEDELAKPLRDTQTIIRLIDRLDELQGKARHS